MNWKRHFCDNSLTMIFFHLAVREFDVVFSGSTRKVSENKRFQGNNILMNDNKTLWSPLKTLYLLPQFLINRKWLRLCACGTLLSTATETCVFHHGKALTSELQLTLAAEMIISKCLSPIISPSTIFASWNSRECCKENKTILIYFHRVSILLFTLTKGIRFFWILNHHSSRTLVVCGHYKKNFFWTEKCNVCFPHSVSDRPIHS